MPVTESQLITWSKPISTTEDEKCKRAVSAVTKAINDAFGNRVTVFLQGSYRNNTNVRLDSDVDIVARFDNVYYPDLVFLTPEEKQIYNARTTNSSYTFANYKAELEAVLISQFGSDVERKNKCINVNGNTYRIVADVVPCFPLKRMRNLTEISAKGIQFFCDDGERVQSFPEQHYNNGVIKTNNTSRMYKRIVRILKNMRGVLIDQKIISENLVSSFFIESLVYNVPNSYFLPSNYLQTLKSVITVIYNDMDNLSRVNEYLEVSELFYLFRGSSRSSADAKEFMLKCWQYAGY